MLSQCHMWLLDSYQLKTGKPEETASESELASRSRDLSVTHEVDGESEVCAKTPHGQVETTRHFRTNWVD